MMNRVGICGVLALTTFCCVAKAEVVFERGVWWVAFDEAGAKLSLSCPSKSIALTGRLLFVSGDETWQVAEPRDAATDRLSLVSGVPRWGLTPWTENVIS